ncbi:SMI1/KNR4 family protein [Agromyces sp. NPDC058136]|uniref:SMI1/KNR4 family protein n=1 Tax=Agromyces sp. NPDC058136 TaxID=3346354 RepID=UPI0036D782F0
MTTARAYLTAVADTYRELDASLELRAPLADEERDELLAPLGGRVPRWLVELWQVADGGPSYSPAFARPGFFTGVDFLSLSQAVALRNRLRDLAGNFTGWQEPTPRDGRIRPGWFPDSWVPFGAFGGSTIVLFADCDPAPGGEIGQVIAYVHDPDQISLLAPDGEAFLAASLEWFREHAEEFVPEE